MAAMNDRVTDPNLEGDVCLKSHKEAQDVRMHDSEMVCRYSVLL